MHDYSELYVGLPILYVDPHFKRTPPGGKKILPRKLYGQKGLGEGIMNSSVCSLPICTPDSISHARESLYISVSGQSFQYNRMVYSSYRKKSHTMIDKYRFQR